jgi:hypothetical protein
MRVPLTYALGWLSVRAQLAREVLRVRLRETTESSRLISDLWIPGLAGHVLNWVAFATSGSRRLREQPPVPTYRDLSSLGAPEGHDADGKDG